MRVLLLGDFSGFHSALAAGLRALGNYVTLASSGDGWKRMPTEMHIGPKSNSVYDRIRWRIDYYNFLINDVVGYDIVQLINPFVLPCRLFPVNKIISSLKRSNGKIFLSACGSDSFYWANAAPALPYGPFDDVIQIDNDAHESFYQTPRALAHNRLLADSVNGIIPVMYDYQLSYRDHPKVGPIIPLPLNLSDINSTPLEKTENLVFFHGLSRPGFKGSRYIERAFQIISNRYPSQVKCIISTQKPYREYLKLVEDVHVIVDQVNSFSYGMNALLGLAMGKVVMSGAEPEAIRALNVPDCPIINIRPSVEWIVQEMEILINKRSKMSMLQSMGPNFVRLHHEATLIASRYQNSWLSA